MVDTETATPINQRFVSEFIEPHRSQIAELGLIDQDIARERMGWFQSGIAESLVDRKIALFAGFGHIIDPKTYLDLCRKEKAVLFGRMKNQDQIKQGYDFQKRALSQLPAKLQKELKEFMVVESACAQEYENSIALSIKQEENLGNNLTDECRGFFTEYYYNLQSFHEFLSSAEYEELREENRPLLQALERRRIQEHSHNRDYWGATKNQILEQFTYKIDHSIFENFMADLKTKAQTPKGGHENRDLLEWLEFCSYSSSGAEPIQIADRIKNSGIYPRALKKLWMEYLDTDLSSHIQQIKRLLDSYKDEYETPILSFGYSTTLEKVKNNKGSRMQTVKPQGSVKMPEIPDEKPERVLLVHQNGQVTTDNLDKFIQDEAQAISRHDKELIEDIKSILESLRKNPFGQGCSKMGEGQKITSPFNPRRIFIWHFRPDKRPDIRFQATGSSRLRVMYYFDDRPNEHNILLLRVIPHDVFDTLYK